MNLSPLAVDSKLCLGRTWIRIGRVRMVESHFVTVFHIG